MPVDVSVDSDCSEVPLETMAKWVAVSTNFQNKTNLSSVVATLAKVANDSIHILVL